MARLVLRSSLLLLLAVPACAYINASAVRVSHPNTPNEVMNLAEILLWDAQGVNCALSGVATASSSAFSPSYIINGVRAGTSSEDFWHSEFHDTWSPWVLVQLPTPCVVASIEVCGRYDCCTSRDIGDTVQLLDASGAVTFTAVIDAFTIFGGAPTWMVTFPPPSATQTPSGSGSLTASPSSTLTPTPGLSCPPSLFRSLPRHEVVGTLLGSAPMSVGSEGACRIACCDTPTCDGYSFSYTELRRSTYAGCFLFSNVTEFSHNILITSGVRESSLL